MKLGFATTDWSQTVKAEGGTAPVIGGAGWYRMALPMRWLAEHGHECHIGTLLFNNKTEAFAVREWSGDSFECDIIVMQRWMEDDVAQYIPLARMNGQKVVNDLDDWFFGIDKLNQAYHVTDPRKNPKSNRDHYARILEDSDLLTVSTPYLWRRCRERFPRVRVELIRNAIDLERWKPKDVDREHKPVLGWVGALPFRSGDLSTDGARAVGAFCNEHKLRFHHSGAVEPSDAYLQALRAGRLTADQVRYGREWYRSAGEVVGAKVFSSEPTTSIDEYPGLFDAIDVGIVPLTDVAFNEAKSAIKAMEYAASGIPSIAQALPEQVHLRSEHGIGRTAGGRSDWTRELRKMMDPSWRQEQRDQNLAGVKALDIADRGAVWQECYESMTR